MKPSLWDTRFADFIESYFPGPYQTPDGKPVFGLDEMRFAWNEAATKTESRSSLVTLGIIHFQLLLGGVDETQARVIAKKIEAALAAAGIEPKLDPHFVKAIEHARLRILKEPRCAECTTTIEALNRLLGIGESI